MFKSRKIILFIISLIAIVALLFFSKDPTAVVMLYGIYCTGNVAQKYKVQ